MATEEHEPLVAVNVSVDGSQKMAGFEVSINGRFWVSTEATTEGSDGAPRSIADREGIRGMGDLAIVAPSLL
jgi:hypothetical protein